ncbi:tRNA lysidine(34) synthetase TilS [Streptococcus didelphis]|uniref:tRNA lysidine(34) synthetase TilS n=1 Tax=Streptococcus didelphis TaxID=102886 RepID=UPI000379AC12|nr:tRNA lysidine(34) synthetase TilS [Streptococcus didelphis]WMB29909.1 tRNA lysidine(34) synthetase TilS [Streptococcus didelphis]
MMYTKIYNYIEEKALFKGHKKVLIAVSGGVDSMNLLSFLHSYQKALNIEIAIAHINHKQRVESDDEEKYLKNWAKKEGIPFFIAYFTGTFSEKSARDFRYNFFKKVMYQENYTALVTAHHADDQAETVLMRIIRGSLLRHLVGIKEIQAFGPGQLIRPFLNITKSQLPTPFHFEDYSNQETHYFRNRVRNNYLPTLSQENPNLNKALFDLANETQFLLQALQDLTEKISVTDLDIFLQQTEAVQYFLLQDYLSHFEDLMVSKKQFQDLLYIIRNKKSGVYPVKNHYSLTLDYRRFEIKKILPETEFTEDEILIEYGSVQNFRDYSFSYKTYELLKESEFTIPLYNLTPITLRGRQTGDKIFLGDFSKKLRRLFIDEKFTIDQRKKAIVGLQENQIIFVIISDKTYLRKAAKDDIMRARLYVEKI